MSQAITCPRCRQQLSSVGPRCPHCDADLQPLLQVTELANRYFNDGLRAARAGHWHLAAEHVAVTLALQPDDVGAMVLLAKISRRQGRRERAVQLWEMASQLAPHREDIRAALANSRRPVPPWRRMLDLAPSWQQVTEAVPCRDEIAELIRGAVWSVPGSWKPVERGTDG
ncbi:MAG: hypothetical protein ACRDRS_00800 [Pseudonocardiaceae bacterium]